MGRSVSPFVLLLIDMETKFTLLVRAVRSPGSIPERVRLGGTALGNFTRKTFRNRFDHRTAMRMADDELTFPFRKWSLFENLERAGHRLVVAQGAKGLDDRHRASLATA